MTPLEPTTSKTISMEAQKNVIKYAETVLMDHRSDTELRNKMTTIDQAYARYRINPTEADNSGDSDVQCDIFASDNVVAPVVVSQVDSLVAYLADVFLSGIPLFPVVSTPFNRKYAEQLETLLDDHALLGGYVRQLLLMFRNSVKYNYGAVETDWSPIDQFSVANDVSNKENGRKSEKNPKFFTKIKALNMYNVLRDRSVAPGDIAEHGDYAGYVEHLSYMRLRTYLKRLQDQKKAMNIQTILASSMNSAGRDANFTEDPQISNYVSATAMRSGSTDWLSYLTESAKAKKRNVFNSFEKVVLYVRLCPSDFAIGAPQPNTPQIWKFVIINGVAVAEASRVISAFDYLPILFCQPLEDGLKYQTQSIAEESMPIQEAASTLFNIRFAASRRSVSDRALYNPDLIRQSDVNSKTPAPKIPVHIPKLVPTKLSDAYESIPFDMRGTENTIQDARTIVEFSKQLKGISNPMQGQFQKGNKSVREWEDTLSGADNRLRLPALCCEYQLFSPLKSMLALNLFQYSGNEVVVISQKTGETLKINIDELRRQTLAFKISDGFTPKSKMASTDMIIQGFNLISTSPILQQQYGTSLPGMFAHMMQLGGVRGLEEYNPQYAPPAPGAQLPGALDSNTPGAIPGQTPGQPSPLLQPGVPPVTATPTLPPA